VLDVIAGTYRGSDMNQLSTSPAAARPRWLSKVTSASRRPSAA